MNRKGRTALMAGARFGGVAVIKTLLANGADISVRAGEVNARTNHETPPPSVQGSPHMRSVSKGVCLIVQGETARELATHYNNVAATELLEEVERVDEQGRGHEANATNHALLQRVCT